MPRISDGQKRIRARINYNKKCPRCGMPMDIKKHNNVSFYVCTNTECDLIHIRGRDGMVVFRTPTLPNPRCPSCKQPMRKVHSEFGAAYVCPAESCILKNIYARA